MSKWRPEGWKNPYCDQCWWKTYNAGEGEEGPYSKCNCIYEAGADAMLEALRNSPHRRVIKDYIEIIPEELLDKSPEEISLIHAGNGIHVFIPEDK